MNKNSTTIPQLIDHEGEEMMFTIGGNSGNTRETFHAKRISVETRDGRHEWNGHPEEEKLFVCISGSVRILMVRLDDWENPSFDLEVLEQVISAAHHRFLKVPAGYATAIQKISKDGKALELSSISQTDFDTSGKIFPKEWWYVETFM